MREVVGRVCNLIFCLAIAGCGAAEPNATESLVGAKELPAESELAGESIEVTRLKHIDADVHLLSYELQTDNDLRIKHVKKGLAQDDVVADESLRLSPKLALKIRRALWRLRPADLHVLDQVEEQYPVGCEPLQHYDAENGVIFIGPDDSVGIVKLPQTCRDGASAEARALINDVMQQLPQTKAVQAYQDLR